MNWDNIHAAKKWFLLGALCMGLVSIGVIVFYKSHVPQKPLPGVAIKQLERDHVSDISDITYTSNPPTSGSHFPLWAKRGVYKDIISDGYLIHSLEHGYIVIFYNCGDLAKSQSSLRYKKGDPLTTMPEGATEIMRPFTPQYPPQDVVMPPKAFQTTTCKKLVQNLSTFLDDFQRIVIIPRTNLDASIVLTAWGRIEKFRVFDKEAMGAFISAYHNKGPEQTVE